MFRKLMGSPITPVIGIIALAWGSVEFYNYVIVPHVRQLSGG